MAGLPGHPRQPSGDDAAAADEGERRQPLPGGIVDPTRVARQHSQVGANADLELAARAILFSAEKATWMALEAIQCLGGNGYINDYPTGRLLRDAKLYEIGAGTSEIRRYLIGRELFEESA